MRRHRRKIVLVMLIGILGVALVVRACLPPPAGRSLLSSATKLSNVRDVLSYSWISNTELLVTASTNGYPTMTFPWTGSVDSIDAGTGKRTRLNGLTAAILQRSHQYDPLGPRYFEASQDGQWLMWIHEDPKAGGLYPVTARRDGSGYHEWNLSQSNRINNSHWIDGHRWITLHYPKWDGTQPDNRKPDSIFLHDAAQPLADRQLPASSAEAQAMIKTRESSFRFPNNTHVPLLYADPHQKAFSLDLTIMTSPFADAKDVAPTKWDTVTFPAGTKLLQNIPNPQGSCIQLQVSDAGIPPYVLLLRKLFPNYPYIAHPTEILYVYHADKKALVEIGRVPKTSSTVPEIQNAWWQPDGKHIQFFYQNAVYIVSTE